MQIKPPHIKLIAYDFTRPIRILAYRPPGLDIMFYAILLTVCFGIAFVLMFFQEGRISFNLPFWGTLMAIPLLLIGALMASLLKELLHYPRQLMKKPRWTLAEMMKLTGKSEKETIRIMTRVLESCFQVDEACILSAEDDRKAKYPRISGQDDASNETGDEVSSSSTAGGSTSAVTSYPASADQAEDCDKSIQGGHTWKSSSSSVW